MKTWHKTLSYPCSIQKKSSMMASSPLLNEQLNVLDLKEVMLCSPHWMKIQFKMLSSLHLVLKKSWCICLCLIKTGCKMQSERSLNELSLLDEAFLSLVSPKEVLAWSSLLNEDSLHDTHQRKFELVCLCSMEVQHMEFSRQRKFQHVCHHLVMTWYKTLNHQRKAQHAHLCSMKNCHESLFE